MMIISFKKWVERVKFILLFLILTYVVYHVIHFLSAWIEPTQRYKEPTGRAVKVFHQGIYYGDETVSMQERLRFFYWYGE